MNLVHIHLPVADNEAKPLEAEHVAIQAQLRELYSGFTVWKAAGSWVDGGKVYHDALLVYEVATAHSLKHFLAFAKEAGKRCRQVAVYLVWNGKPKIISVGN